MKPLVLPSYRGILTGTGVLSVALLSTGLYYSQPIVMYGEQSRYEDKVVFSQQTKYQHITLTQYKSDYWLFLNNSKQLSTFDEWLYHEPLVHPAMLLSKQPKRVLILGGGDGCAIREVLKYPSVDSVIQIELDPEMTEVGTNHPVFRKMNQDAYWNPKVRVINWDAFDHLAKNTDYFDVIIADFPDPKSIELNRLYTLEFYKLCYKHLRPNGIFVTQAGSPYYATKAFKCLDRTLTEAGFNTMPMHNHVLTLGEWGYMLGAKGPPKESLKPQLLRSSLDDISTRWLTEESFFLLTSFGKNLVPVDTVEVNALHNPVLNRYYHQGNWDI